MFVNSEDDRIISQLFRLEMLFPNNIGAVQPQIPSQKSS